MTYMISLTEATQLRLNRLFLVRDRDEAVRLLAEDCDAERMHLPAAATQREVERCHFAVLKLSGGSLESLIEAVALAQSDYRDLLMTAEFGEDVNAHRDWLPPARSANSKD